MVVLISVPHNEANSQPPFFLTLNFALFIDTGPLSMEGTKSRNCEPKQSASQQLNIFCSDFRESVLRSRQCMEKNVHSTIAEFSDG